MIRRDHLQRIESAGDEVGDRLTEYVGTFLVAFGPEKAVAQAVLFIAELEVPVGRVAADGKAAPLGRLRVPASGPHGKVGVLEVVGPIAESQCIGEQVGFALDGIVAKETTRPTHRLVIRVTACVLL